MLMFISEVRWRSPESNFIASAQATIVCNEFEYLTFLNHSHPEANELICAQIITKECMTSTLRSGQSYDLELSL